jgi:chromosome segregation ATPase
LRADTESQVKVLEVSLAQSRGDQEELREQLSHARQQNEGRGREIEQLQQQVATQAQAEPVVAEDPALVEEVESLRAQCAGLSMKFEDATQHLEKTQRQLEQARAEGGKGGGQQVDDLKRRLEMAMEEIRELKGEKSKLQKKLDAAAKSGGAAVLSEGLDWESQKQRLLAQLESDFDPNDERQAADRLTVENAIEATQQAMEEKDAEIDELKQLLNSQSGNIGEMAVGAHAIAEILDQDDLIREERESLRRMQEEWREKLRRAEVDISVERAKMGRERAELEEKLQAYQAQNRNLEDVMGKEQGENEKGKKPAGRRWLARLGLKESDE